MTHERSAISDQPSPRRTMMRRQLISIRPSRRPRRGANALLSDPSLPALYEAAFSYDDVAVRADIVVRQGMHEFDLIEVKSTATWKEPHLFDLAVQLYVLEGAGIRVGRTCCLRELGAALPEFAPRLAQLRARLFNLHPVSRRALPGLEAEPPVTPAPRRSRTS